MASQSGTRYEDRTMQRGGGAAGGGAIAAHMNNSAAAGGFMVSKCGNIGFQVFKKGVQNMMYFPKKCTYVF